MRSPAIRAAISSGEPSAGADKDFVEGKFSYTMVTRFDLKRNAEGHYRGTFKTVHDGIKMPPLVME